MKGFLIGPDNQRFEAEIVRYFQNVNDHYLIYTKNEKDANGYILLYATKVISDSGIKVGENITDENEWALIKSFLQKTVSENKEGRPVSIADSNPAEINDLKINNQRPFKLSETSVELFGKNKKSFEIVQKMAEEQNTVKNPVAPEVTEFVVDEQPVENVVNAVPVEISTPEVTSVEQSIVENIANSEPIETTAFDFEIPTVVENNAIEIKNEDVSAVAEVPSIEVSSETQNVVNNENVETAISEVAPVEQPTVESEAAQNFEELYKNEVEKNDALTKEIEQLLKDNALYKEKLDKIKELLN